MKIRLDVCMVNRSLAATREKARARILAGEVLVDGAAVTKPGAMIPEDAQITLTGEGERFVGRGGRKLEKILAEYRPSLEGRVCIDVGASTGGFTDCMLQRGAAKVFAVDVGTDQLAESLRKDPRVVNLEKTDIRTLTQEKLGGAAGFAGIDVSFISLAKVLPAVAALLAPGAELGCLVKPQFEVGRENIGKHGIAVRDERVHREMLLRVIACARAAGFDVRGLSYSPIRGGSGNLEYLLYAAYEPGAEQSADGDAAAAERTVHEAFLHYSQQGERS